jgi:hypothetical protein
MDHSNAPPVVDTGIQRSWSAVVRDVGVLFGLGYVLWRFGGTTGAVLWLAILGSWLVFQPVITVVLGQFGIAAVTSADSATVLITAIALCALLEIPDTLGYGVVFAVFVAVVLYATTTAGLIAGIVLGSGIVIGVSVILRQYLSVVLAEMSGHEPVE